VALGQQKAGPELANNTKKIPPEVGKPVKVVTSGTDLFAK
jgi:hypothetical protein